jgi:DNA-binding XRE family transcriptional regulator
MMEPLGGIIRTRREELNLSQAELARAAGVHVRQIRRYESGEQQPVLAVAVKMAAALGVTLDQLAGVARDNARLEGAWWAAWEAGPAIVSHPVHVTQHGSSVRLEAPRHDRPGWLWRGDLTLWDGLLLTGHYAGADGNPRSKGAMFFVLDAEANTAEGRRVGLAYDGAIVSGHAALARDRDAAHAAVERLMRAVPSGPGSPVTP